VDISDQIKQKLSERLRPVYLDLQNESHMHAGPATDSHFKLVLVSAEFEELSAVKRHQTVYKTLKEELAGSVHALAMHLYSVAEWKKEKTVPGSPTCAGKNK
jgi:BolA protein